MKFEFGTLIREKRKEQGLSLADVASLANISSSMLGKIEKDERKINKDLIPKLAKALKVEEELLMTRYVSNVIYKELKKFHNYDDIMDLVKEKLDLYNSGQLNFDFGDDWRDKKFSNPAATLRIGTLFSGIGAIEYAFKRLHINTEITFASDIDKFVKQSYLANYNIKDEDWYDDVYDLKGDKYLGIVDLLVGGSPCQSFSIIGKRRGLEDARGTLFYEFARIVKESQPKVFIYENVKGLLSHDNGKTWEIMQRIFEDLGYKFYFQVLNARDYGMPQHRERIFVVGFKDHNIKFQFPTPIQLEHTMQDFLEDYIDSKYYLKEKGVKFVTSTKNRKKRYTQINGDIALCQKANQQFNWHGDFVYESSEKQEFDEFVFDVNKDVEEKYYLSEKVKNYVLAGGTKNFKTSTKTDLEVARPLLQTMHKMHRAGVDNYVTHNKGRIRKLTPKECLRLMGFRDDFKQVVSDTQLYRQAGNSIVVDVLIAILKQMDITKFGK